jgi:hypothetical protein
MANSLQYVTDQLEKITRTAENGQPFWLGRELMVILGYTSWHNFRDTVIEKAKEASNNAGVFSSDHFIDIDEVITVGKGAKSKRENTVLSRHACYLVAAACHRLPPLATPRRPRAPGFSPGDFLGFQNSPVCTFYTVFRNS